MQWKTDGAKDRYIEDSVEKGWKYQSNLGCDIYDTTQLPALSYSILCVFNRMKLVVCVGCSCTNQSCK